MRIWLFRSSENLPIDEGEPRLFRMGLTAEELSKRNVEVTWWSSAFDHFNKKFRSDRTKTVAINSKYNIVLLHGDGYKRNMSIGRIMHESKEEKQFYKIAETLEEPDLVFASMPNLAMAHAAVKYAKKHNIPSYVDIRDMWPDEIVNQSSHKWLMKLIVSPMDFELKWTLRNATGIIGTSPKFLDWGLNKAHRTKTAKDAFFYVSYPDTNDIALKDEDVTSWLNQGLQEDDLICCFFGQFGNAVDLEPIIDAAIKISKKTKQIKFVLCGSGERIEEYRKRTRDTGIVLFPGWVDRRQICALGKLSSIGLLCYKKTNNFEWSLPNKFCEYLALGQTLLMAPSGLMEDLANEHGCGLRYQDSDDLANILMGLNGDREKVKKMKTNARKLYDKSFNAAVEYGRMAEFIINQALEDKKQ